jgi:hypothetical protein
LAQRLTATSSTAQQPWWLTTTKGINKLWLIAYSCKSRMCAVCGKESFETQQHLVEARLALMLHHAHVYGNAQS